MPKDKVTTNNLKFEFIKKQLEELEIGKREILELGSGSGWLSNQLKSKEYNVTTLDRDGDPDIKTDLLNYSPEKKYKAIISIDFVEHGYFNEKIAWLLEEGGYFICVYPKPKYNSIMTWLSKHKIWNGDWYQHILEHKNFFEPKEFPLKLLKKETILFVNHACVWKKVKVEN